MVENRCRVLADVRFATPRQPRLLHRTAAIDGLGRRGLHVHRRACRSLPRTRCERCGEYRILQHCARAAAPRGPGASLCLQIHPSRARVLPKFRTSQRGLTLRSFSSEYLPVPRGRSQATLAQFSPGTQRRATLGEPAAVSVARRNFTPRLPPDSRRHSPIRIFGVVRPIPTGHG